ncbi:MAG: DsbA family protein [Actinomycetota bacterium]
MSRETWKPSRAAERRTREEARRRAADLRRAQQRTDERRRRLLGALVAVAVLAAAVAVGVAVQSRRAGGGGALRVPPGVVDGTGFAVGRASAPVTVEVYEDFQCPACRAFEQASGQTLGQLAESGAARVVYRPIAFLDSASTTRYSTRALNAAACVAADAGVAAFQRFHALLYADQPAEGSAGLPDSRLVSLGAQAGANASTLGTLGTCVRDLTYQAWTRQVTDTASRHGVNATPTVLVNGRRLAVPTPANLQAAVRAAAG